MRPRRTPFWDSEKTSMRCLAAYSTTFRDAGKPCPFGELAHLRKKRTWLKIPAVTSAYRKGPEETRRGN